MASRDITRILLEKRSIDHNTKDPWLYSYKISETRYLPLKETVDRKPSQYAPLLTAGFPEARGEKVVLANDILEKEDASYPIWSQSYGTRGIRRYKKDLKISVAVDDDLFRRVFLPVSTGYKTQMIAGPVVEEKSKDVYTDYDYKVPEPYLKDGSAVFTKAHSFSKDRYHRWVRTVIEARVQPRVSTTKEGIVSADEAFKPLKPREDIRSSIQKSIENLAAQPTFLGYTTREEWSAPYLIFDVDSDNLEESQQQAIALIDIIKELICEYRGKDKPLKKHKISLGIVYSGSKGFHVYVPVAALNSQVPVVFKKIAKVIKERYSLSCLDMKIYDSERIIRVPGSVNKKTGDLCCVIDEKLLRSDIQTIKNYSKRLKDHLVALEQDKKSRRPKLYYLPTTTRGCLNLPLFVSRLCMTKLSPYKDQKTFGDKTYSCWKPLDDAAWFQLAVDLEVGLQRWGAAPVARVSLDNAKSQHSREESVVRYPTQQFVDFFARAGITTNRSLSFHETVAYLKTVDFRPLFGLPEDGRSFRCWYHKDNNPSAVVISPTAETPVFLYRCYANSSEHPYKNIIDLTMDYFGCTFKEAVHRLAAALGIAVREGQNAVAREEIKDLLEDTITEIQSARLRYNVYSLFCIVRAIYNFGLSLTEYYDVSPKDFYFGVTVRKIAEVCNYSKTLGLTVRMINLCHSLGLLRKVDPDEVPAWYRNNVVIDGLRQARGTEVNYFQLTADWSAEDILAKLQLWISAGGRNDNASHQKLAEVFGIENDPAYEVAAIIDGYQSMMNKKNVPEATKAKYAEYIQELIKYREEYSAEQLEARLRRAASHHQTGRGDTSVTIVQRFEACVVLHNIRECLLARYLLRVGYVYNPRYFFGDISQDFLRDLTVRRAVAA